jgi:hypothetical protein
MVAVCLVGLVYGFRIFAQTVVGPGGTCSECGPITVDGQDYTWCCHAQCDVGCGDAELLSNGDIGLYCYYDPECSGSFE